MREITYNTMTPTPEALLDFYTEVNKLTGKPRYKHLHPTRWYQILKEITTRARKQEAKLKAYELLAS